jgi:hypothetical protein
MVVLKGEAVLFTMPTAKLVSGLKKVLKIEDNKIKNKVLLIFSEFQKTSESFFDYLAISLKKAKNDKELLPYIECLGRIQHKKSIPILESQLDGSPIISYSALVSLLRAWGQNEKFPVMRYLEHEKLNDVTKQMALKHYVKIISSENISEVMVNKFLDLLKSTNLNLRYIASQALVKVQEDSVAEPFFSALVKETDDTAKKLLHKNLAVFFETKPILFVSIFESHINDAAAIEELFNVIKDTELDKHKTLEILLGLILDPANILQTNYKEMYIDLFISFLNKQWLTLDEFLEIIGTMPQRRDFIILFAKGLGNLTDTETSLHSEKIELWLKEGITMQTEALMKLMTFTEKKRAIQTLVSVICDDTLSSQHGFAAQALNDVLGEPL